VTIAPFGEATSLGTTDDEFYVNIVASLVLCYTCLRVQARPKP